MIVAANSLGGLIAAYLQTIQTAQPPARAADPQPAATAPPGGGTSLPGVGAQQPAVVVSPLSSALARQAYQAQASAVQRAQLVG